MNDEKTTKRRKKKEDERQKYCETFLRERRQSDRVLNSAGNSDSIGDNNDDDGGENCLNFSGAKTQNGERRKEA